jgi:predicted RND superfamily exporter protein
VSAFAAVASLFGITKLNVGNHALEFFRDEDPIYQHAVAIDAALGGAFSYEVLVTADEPGQLKNPEVLAQMRATAEFLQQLDGVSRARSLVDVITEVDRAMNDREIGALPQSREIIAQYLLLIEGDTDLTALVDPEYKSARISARLEAGKGDRAAEKIAQVHRHLEETYQGSVHAQSTGLIELMRNVESYLLHSQLRSLGLACLLVTLAMIAILGNVRLGIISAIPNLLPIGMTLGLMGYLGIRLDAGTIMVAPVALGLVVDDTIHFLHHIRMRLEAGDTLRQAVDSAMTVAGPPIVSTSVILVGGFWTLLAASFRPNMYFGLLSGVTMAFALLGDLLLLPALLPRCFPRSTGSLRATAGRSQGCPG